jgi:L-gulonate 3-dehydrogenase
MSSSTTTQQGAPRMPKVAIVGAGLIGRSWAIVFARAGWDVALTDSDAATLAAVPDLIRAGLEKLAEHGLVPNPASAASRAFCAKNLVDALDGAALAQENLPERVEVKQAIFAELDRLAAPETVLASSTSAIVASRFTEELKGRARCLVAHPVNPPHLVPVVELCGAPWTAPEIVAQAHAIYTSTGQRPIVVRREIDGFILNRLQGALLSEAFRLVGQDFVTPQDLDDTVRHGLGLRWSFMGPFETIELNAPEGTRDYCARYAESLKTVPRMPAGPDVWDAPNVGKVVAAWGESPGRAALAEKSAWRDRELAALAAHKKLRGL